MKDIARNKVPPDQRVPIKTSTLTSGGLEFTVRNARGNKITGGVSDRYNQIQRSALCRSLDLGIDKGGKQIAVLSVYLDDEQP